MRRRTQNIIMSLRFASFCLLLSVPFAPAQPLPLEGIGHVGLLVSGLEQARSFYTGQLGFPDAFEMKNNAGAVAAAFYKINDEQFLEIMPGADTATSALLTHVALQASDIRQVWSRLNAAGLHAPEPTKGADGNLSFNTFDPDGFRIQFVQYLPGSLHSNTMGKFLDPRRISTHLQHAGIPVPAEKLDAVMHFYRDQLGLEEFWRYAPGGELRLIKLLIPGQRRDMLELMIYHKPPTGAELASMGHINFAVPDITPPFRTLLARGAAAPYPIHPAVNAEHLWAMDLHDPAGTRVEIQDLKNVPVIRIAIAGLVHNHVAGLLPRLPGRYDVELAGIAEPDAALAHRYAEKYHLPASIFYSSLDTMLDKVKPQAVVIYTDTLDHLKVVEACAARHIDVMMEKPLSVDLKQARAMQAAARRGHIHVMVNYETTWYASNAMAYSEAKTKGSLGPIRKMVAHDGHRGPKEIGVTPEFLDWLTDPVRNGAGALYDFGCYGADLMTWLMGGERPISVTAVAGHDKPEIYPKVEDEATVILTYPHAQGIIQASWNWPFDRKDLEVYGAGGSLTTIRSDRVSLHLPHEDEQIVEAPPLDPREADSLAYLSAVVRGDIAPSGLTGLETNVIVMEILTAARESAATHRTVRLPPPHTGN
jgi:glucose-fructose oxidoreductase